MITQIEIDGFKSFKDFKVELAPFQVILGPNGSGKSNLFDALYLLSRLASTDIASAFQEMRGDASELFTVLPNGKRGDRMRFAVELLVDRKVKNTLGIEVELKHTRLRYELEIADHIDEYGLARLSVIYESLKSIPRDEDTWCKKYELSSQSGWLPEPSTQAAFIDTGHFIKSIEGIDYLDMQVPIITLYRDDQMPGNTTQFRAEDLSSTTMGMGICLGNDTFHLMAARGEFRSWQFFHLNHEALRQPISVNALPFLAMNGSNLPTMLAYMQMRDELAFHFVSLDMANLVPGMLNIRVEKNRASNEYDLWATTADSRSFSAQVLSDGTLRLLALAALRNDPRFHGVLCLEEPENSVDPLHLQGMARLLREMATDFTDLEQVDEPLRQILITTHSPAFISQPDVIDSLLFALMLTRVEPRQHTIQVTRMVPAITSNTELRLMVETDISKAEENYTIDQIQKYLDSNSLEKARDQLEEARSAFNER